MHELSITQHILHISLQEAEKHNAKKVRAIRIKMGILREIVPQCINYYFEIISRGSIAENALIEIERLPLLISCRECGYSSEADYRNFRCPLCHSQSLDIIQGNEFYIDSLEVD